MNNDMPIGQPKKSRKDMTKEERAIETNRMIHLRAQGATYRSLATMFGLNHTTIQERITKALKEAPVDDINLIRTMEIEKLDYYLQKLSPKVKEGHVPSINQAVNISKRRSDLLGLDRPRRHEVVMRDSEDELAEQLVDQFLEMSRLQDQAENDGA